MVNSCVCVLLVISCANNRASRPTRDAATFRACVRVYMRRQVIGQCAWSSRHFPGRRAFCTVRVHSAHAWRRRQSTLTCYLTPPMYKRVPALRSALFSFLPAWRSLVRAIRRLLSLSVVRIPLHNLAALLLPPSPPLSAKWFRCVWWTRPLPRVAKTEHSKGAQQNTGLHERREDRSTEKRGKQIFFDEKIVSL